MRSSSVTHVDPPTSTLLSDHIQGRIGDATSLKLSSVEYEAHLIVLQDVTRSRGINLMLEQNNLNVIVGSAESR